MLKIQVLGTGMIPRGYGLAPRLEPFYADLTFISTIMSTNGLTVRYLNPTTNQFADLTKANLKKVYDKYENVGYGKDAPVNTHPHVPDVKTTPVTKNPASVTKASVGLGDVTPVTEVIHTDPPQYVTPKAHVEQNKPIVLPPVDHTKPEEKKEESIAPVAAPVVEEKKEVVTENNDSIKPVNAPANNQNKNNGKK